ncbi:serpin family protein [Photobacterium swingsii]|uniref:serpin family protein n=1 Tax=Photobacterium swingsii TaxID=680026 RepID=UPI003D0B0059
MDFKSTSNTTFFVCALSLLLTACKDAEIKLPSSGETANYPVVTQTKPTASSEPGGGGQISASGGEKSICPDSGDSSSFDMVKKVSRSYNHFSVELYKSIARDAKKERNILISPLSVAHSLSMVMAGARGNTLWEIGNVLDIDGTAPASTTREQYFSSALLHENINQFQNYLNEPSKPYTSTLSINNAYFPSRHIRIEQDFSKTLEQCYDSKITPVNFTEQENAAETINDWVFKATKGIIPKIINEEEIEINTTSILTNAVYFKGLWKKPFDPKKTEKDFFSGAGNDGFVETDMMYQSNAFKYAKSIRMDTAKIDVLELPYDEGRYSMFIFNPSGNDAQLDQLESEMTSDNLTNVMESVSQENEYTVSVLIPKFTLNDKLELVDYLKYQGINSAFGEGADFSRVSVIPNHISNVEHFTNVEVDESGTVGAVATSVSYTGRSMIDSFIVNGSFLFIIRDNNSKSILFIGRYVNAG